MRRGQITVFIILGLAVLLAVAIVLYFTAQQVVFRGGVIVPREAQPVYDYVSSCSSTLGEEAITILGLQGGFVEIPDDIARTPTSYVPIDERGIVRIPLWYYEGEGRVPSLALMEAHIAQYVEENIPACIDNFSAFVNQYPVIAQAEPQVSATIGEDDVTIRLAYPVQIQRDGQIVDVPEFVSELPVALKEAYDLAVKTMQRENNEAWFENLTIDLMTANPNIPFDGLEFDCSPKSWRLTDIRAELQETLRFNLPAIRVANTEHAPFNERESAYRRVQDVKLEDYFQGRLPTNVPDDQYEYGRLRFDAGIARSGLSAAFIYNPAWGMDLNGQPNKGGVLSSKLTKGSAEYLRFLCTNFYHFTYDVIYPVVMVIRDDEAFLGKGFTFQFAFPVIIDDNAGSRRAFGYREFRGFEQSTGFCDNLGSQLLEVRASGLEPEIGVVELGDVTIDYECITQVCTLGTTKAYEGFYRWIGRLPEGCSAPTIIARKPGYLAAREIATGDRVDITMPRLREMNVNVLKHPYDGEVFYPPQSLTLGQNVTLHLSVQGQEFDQFITVPAENQTLFLVDGPATYSLNAVLTQFGNMVGGYQNDSIRITAREIDGTDTITINVVEMIPPLQTDKYRTEVAQYLYEGDYDEALKPRLS